MELKEQILQVLDDGDYCKISLIEKGIEIGYGSMYHPPKLGFDKLMQLSVIFGTTKIDVDNYSNSGCETCDYGSDYGHTIQIYEPTTNLDNVSRLIGLDLKSRE